MTENIREYKGNYYVPVTISNVGEETVESLQVEIIHTSTENSRESSSFTFQFLAGGGKAEAVAVFGNDPRQGTITSDILGYINP
jgi:uncharacterized protein (TIGR02588 family)